MLAYAPLIWAALRRRLLRSVLTVSTIAVGFYLLGILEGFALGFDAFVARLPDSRLSVAPRSLTQAVRGLPLTYLDAVGRTYGVKAVAPTDSIGTYYQIQSQHARVLATNLDYFRVYDEYLVTEEALAAFARSRTGMIAGRVLADQYGWQLGDRVPLIDERTPQRDGSTAWTFEVVGFWDTPSTSTAVSMMSIVHYDYLEEARLDRKGIVAGLMLSVMAGSNPIDVARTIDEMFINSSTPTRTQSIRELVEQQLQRIGDIEFFVNAVVGSALLTILFVTAGTMMQSTRERTPEYAVMKSFGFEDRTIAALALGESLTMCLAGAACGLLVAFVTGPGAIETLGLGSTPIPAVTLGYGFAAAAILATASVAGPLIHIRRSSVVDALAGR